MSDRKAVCFVSVRLRCVIIGQMKVLAFFMSSLVCFCSSLTAPRVSKTSVMAEDTDTPSQSANYQDMEYIYDRRKFVEIVHRDTYGRLVVDPKTGQILVKNFQTVNVGKEGEKMKNNVMQHLLSRQMVFYRALHVGTRHVKIWHV